MQNAAAAGQSAEDLARNVRGFASSNSGDIADGQVVEQSAALDGLALAEGGWYRRAVVAAATNRCERLPLGGGRVHVRELSHYRSR